MKQKLHIFMTLLLLMICGGVSFGQTFKKVTDASEIEAGGEYLIVYEKANKAYGGISSSDYGTAEDVEIENSTISSVGSAHIVKVGGEKDKWTLFDETVKKYLALTSATKGKLYVASLETDKGATWKISASKITNVDNSTYFLQYNSNAKRFACYPSSSKQLDVILYKKEIQDGKTATKLSFGTDYDSKTITKKVGDIYEALATLTPSVEGATITYESSDATVAEVADGIVEAKKEGTAIITATYAGNDSYRGSSASYTIKVEKIATTLSFLNKSYSFIEGDQNGTAVIEHNAAVLSPEGAGEVTYKVEGADGLAVVLEDGSVLVNTNIIGTATVTASFAGNDKYLAATDATYTIKVNKKVPDGVFDFTGTEDYGSGLQPKDNNGYNNKFEGNTEWTAGIVTINTTGNTRWWKNTSSNEFRFYKGSALTVSVPEGYVINDIALTGAYSFKASEGTYNDNSGKWTGYANSVKFTYNAKSGNIAVKTITVKYTKLATLTTAASGFATYAADYDVDYSAAGLKAYAITLDDAAKTVKYTEATGVVPAGKAVLVKGESKTEYTLAPATEEADATFTTDLQISDGTVTTEGGLYYAFATVDGKSGFKKLADDLTIPAKKGYLILSAASAKSFFAFDETTTGINEIEAEAAQDNAAIYNLAGQRVSKDYKGVVIKNGKKFLNK